MRASAKKRFTFKDLSRAAGARHAHWRVAGELFEIALNDVFRALGAKGR